jgi:hypothetical protein
LEFLGDSVLDLIVAEELYVRPERLRIELAPADRSYDNPELGFQITGGSTSVHSSWDALRNAGATTFVALRRERTQALAGASVVRVPLLGLLVGRVCGAPIPRGEVGRGQNERGLCVARREAHRVAGSGDGAWQRAALERGTGDVEAGRGVLGRACGEPFVERERVPRAACGEQ